MTQSQPDLHGALGLAPHASRIVLVLAAFLLARIGSRYLIDPVGALAPDGIVLQSANATTVVRVGLGAFPLAIAIFAVGSVLLPRALMAATALIATVMATALVARITAIVAHGDLGASRGPLIGESVFLTLSLVALAWSFVGRSIADRVSAN